MDNSSGGSSRAHVSKILSFERSGRETVECQRSEAGRAPTEFPHQTRRDLRVQAVERDRKKREAVLQRIQQLMYEKMIFAPLWEPVLLSGVGPKVEESGLGLLSGYPYSLPYEDVKLKKN